MNLITQPLHFAFVCFANAGKSTLFNKVANATQKTGNWTGVTVSIAQKLGQLNNHQVLFTDIPGIPSLSKREFQSKDLSISHDFIKDGQIDCLINVVDATQLKRQLYLTTQLLELGYPMIVVLTKVDRKEADNINPQALSHALGCPVIALDGRQNNALEKVESVTTALPQKSKAITSINLPEHLEAKLNSDMSLLALEQLLHGEGCQCKSDNDDALLIMQARFSAIEDLLKTCLIANKKSLSLSDKLDNVILHPLLGTPIFLLSMYLLFMFSINIGGAFIDFFDIIAGTIFVDYPQQWLAELSLPVWLLTIIAGVGGGIQTVATFIPIIVCLFIGLSLLETSGYLARAAFVVESVMQKIGLPGKAFVPLIVGFGCTVPAVMSARVLDNERERITTIMMSPFMSCGARLPVYALFAAAFFPESGQNLVFLLYLIGILAAIFTGFLIKVTLLPGTSQFHIMELPLYEMPRLSYLIKRVWQRTKSFILGVGKTIVIVVCVLNFFNSLGVDGEFGHNDTDSSILSQGAQIVTPLLSPMGIKEDNWQAGVGIITGIFAKEALVATFNSLYSTPEAESENTISFSARWQEAIDSVLQNLLGIAPDDPLGVDVGNVSSLTAAAEEQDVELSTYYAMQNAFTGQLGAFSYLLFILLYTPCAAAMGAIKNEVGNRWASFAGLWSFTLAYLSATACYQIGAIGEQPIISLITLGFVVLSFASIYLWLKHKGKNILSIPVAVSYT